MALCILLSMLSTAKYLFLSIIGLKTLWIAELS
jgi:hypothetical protein